LWGDAALAASAAARVAFTKAAMRAGSLSPGARSTPDDTSTPGAPVVSTALRTFVASRPPDTMYGLPISMPARICQSNGTPLPPGSAAPGAGLASNRMRSATRR